MLGNRVWATFTFYLCSLALLHKTECPVRSAVLKCGHFSEKPVVLVGGSFLGYGKHLMKVQLTDIQDEMALESAICEQSNALVSLLT